MIPHTYHDLMVGSTLWLSSLYTSSEVGFRGKGYDHKKKIAIVIIDHFSPYSYIFILYSYIIFPYGYGSKLGTPWLDGYKHILKSVVPQGSNFDSYPYIPNILDVPEKPNFCIPRPSPKNLSKTPKTPGNPQHRAARWILLIVVIPSGYVNSLLLKMAIEIVSFPIKNGGSFHSYVNVYQRVSPIHWLVKYKSTISMAMDSIANC